MDESLRYEFVVSDGTWDFTYQNMHYPKVNRHFDLSLIDKYYKIRVADESHIAPEFNSGA